MRTPRFFAALICVLALFACDPYEPDIPDVPDTPDTPDTPTTPTAPKGYVTLPTKGGILSLGDMAITFPKGSYPSDVFVSLKKVKAGEAMGDDEVSAFYELTIPPQLGKELTIKLKCEETGSDVFLVAHTPVAYLSQGESAFSNIPLASEYKDGTYIATIPALPGNEAEEDDELTFSLGVAHLQYCGKNLGTKAELFGDTFKEGNVSWHFNFAPYFKQAHTDQLTLYWEEMNGIIREAIKKLHDLGLQVTDRNIGMSFDDLGDPDGAFGQSFVCNEWSTVSFNTKLLTGYPGTKDRFRRSAIHEIMHVYQADYDSRSPFNKAGGITGKPSKGGRLHSDELLLLYESGAVWAEHFMGGSFSTPFAMQYIPSFIKGFDNIDEIYKDEAAANTRHKRYEFHGYGASILMYYITKGLREYKLGDDSILELYKIWNKNPYTFSTQGPRDYITALTRGKGHNVFGSLNYDEFLVSLAKGELVPDINVSKLKTGREGTIKPEDSDATVPGTCYPYGGMIKMVALNLVPKDYENIGNMEIVVSSEDEQTTSYVFSNFKGNIDYQGLAWKDNKLVIPCSNIAQYINKSESNFLMYFYVMTCTTSDKPRDYKVQVVLQDALSVTPDELSFPPAGGTKSVKVNVGSYKRYGYRIPEEYKDWISAKLPGNCVVDFTLQPNTTGQKREAIVFCYVSNIANAPDEDKVFLPVKIYQEAGAGFEGLISTLVSAEFSVMENGTPYVTHQFFRIPQEAQWSVSQSGTTMHFSTAYQQEDSNNISVKYTCAFDIIGFEGDMSKSKVQNYNYRRETKMINTTGQASMRIYQLVTFMIPELEQGSFFSYSDGTARLSFSGYEAFNNLSVNNFIYTEKWLDWQMNEYTTDYSISPDQKNSATVTIDFRHNGTKATPAALEYHPSTAETEVPIRAGVRL